MKYKMNWKNILLLRMKNKRAVNYLMTYFSLIALYNFMLCFKNNWLEENLYNEGIRI